jgi:Tfp pilus assembly pilus retraction ATPase PilT
MCSTHCTAKCYIANSVLRLIVRVIGRRRVPVYMESTSLETGHAVLAYEFARNRTSMASRILSVFAHNNTSTLAIEYSQCLDGWYSPYNVESQ